jgi:hypothetical protein
MSRSKKDAKGGHRGKHPGWECWSKRPGADLIGAGRRAKQIAHHLERAKGKRGIRKEQAQ